MDIRKDISKLVEANVITSETADKIQDYYKNNGGSSTNKLFIIFGVLGAIMVGLGVILIIAHNWDEFSRGTKAFFAFLPLIIGQVFCVFALTKRQGNAAWRESVTAFLFFAVGASISLVSQAYNISGDLSAFLLTWMLLCFPLIYAMRSSAASILFLIGITYYACEAGYWSYPSSDPYLYWLMLAGVIPHYYQLLRRNPESNAMLIHHWIIPLSVVITLGTLAGSAEELMLIAYLSLFGALYLMGDLGLFSDQRAKNNSYKILGSIGTMVLLLALSFDGFWEELRVKSFPFGIVIATPEFFVSTITSLLAGGLFYLHYKKKTLYGITPLAPIFILFIITFFIGIYSPIAVLLINGYVLVIGVFTIRDGAKQDHLGILNYGLLVITALVICRFLDTNLSFAVRGIMFVLVGTGFFIANYKMLKKRKTDG